MELVKVTVLFLMAFMQSPKTLVDCETVKSHTQTVRCDIALALVKSTTLQSFVGIDDAQLDRIDASKNLLVTELTKSSSTSNIVKQFNGHASRVHNYFQYEQAFQSDLIVTDVLLRSYAKDEQTYELLKPFIASSIRNSDPAATNLLAGKTAKALEVYGVKRETLSVGAIDKFTKTLSKAQRASFHEIVGSLSGPSLSCIAELKGLDDAYRHCVEELFQAIETRSMEDFADLDLSALQVAKLWNGIHSADVMKLVKKISKIEEEATLIRRDGIDSADAILRIEKRIETIGLKCIRDTLDPGQLKLLRQMSARTFLSQSNKGIFNWPLLLKSELKLKESEINELAERAEQAKRDYEKAVEDLRRELIGELYADLPMDLLEFIDRLPEFCQNGVIDENVFRAYRSHNVLEEARR